jgi:hypothetical protein
VSGTNHPNRRRILYAVRVGGRRAAMQIRLTGRHAMRFVRRAGTIGDASSFPARSTPQQR